MLKPLIILPSDSMDGNKKQGRNEDTLLRMAKATRDGVAVETDTVTLSGVANSKELCIYKAFSKDLIKVRELILEDALSYEDSNRVAFVSSKTFKELGFGIIYKKTTNAFLKSPHWGI